MEYKMEPKDEYIAELSQALFGKLSMGQINSQVRYYDHYISQEVEKGKSQEQVIEELGGAVDLARQIVEKVKENQAKEEPQDQVITRKVTRANRFAQAAQSHGYTLADKPQEEEVQIQERTYTEADQYLDNYHGIKAEYSEEKGWEVKAGPFKLNKWYGTVLILAVILIIWGLIEKFTG